MAIASLSDGPNEDVVYQWSRIRSAGECKVKEEDSAATPETPSLSKTDETSYGEGWIYSKTDKTFAIFIDGSGYVVTGSTGEGVESNGNHVVASEGGC